MPKVAGKQRYQRRRSMGHSVKLNCNKAFAGVNVPSGQQLLKPFETMRVAPNHTQMIRKRPVDSLVVGVAENAVYGIPEPRQ